MSDPIIHAQGLSKRYFLDRNRRHDRSLAGNFARAITRRVRPSTPEAPDEGRYIWALRDVSFSIQPGEAVGIIGPNGAGKSTLLKVMSRLTLPTEGSVSIRGRVGSMLELGVGFKAELSGRENVYLSGMLLGIPRAEIRRKFDEIVEYSGIAEFIDVPVKRYSSGMRVRLGFSVISTLEPEVLLIDEVLGVGDAGFRQRSGQRMEELIGSGRTVLLVSHSQRAIEKLCDRCIHLERGRVVHEGSTAEVADRYAEEQLTAEQKRSEGHGAFTARPERRMCLREAAVLDTDGNPAGTVEMNAGFRIRVGYDINAPVEGAHVFCKIETMDGLTVLSSGDADTNADHINKRSRGSYSASFRVPPGLLEAGRYQLTVSMGAQGTKPVDRRVAAANFTVEDRSSARRTWYLRPRPGVIGHDLDWEYDGRSPWE